MNLAATVKIFSQWNQVSEHCHYENMPIQIYRKFHLQKLKFSDKTDIFQISAQNLDCGYSLEVPR